MQVHMYEYHDTLDHTRANRYCLSRTAELEVDRRIGSALAIGYEHCVLMMQSAEASDRLDPLVLIVDTTMPMSSFVLYGVDPEDGSLHPVY